MEYFKDPDTQEVYAYDPDTQQDLIDIAVAKGWENITGSWPPPPPPPDWEAINKAQAMSLLQATDWTESPSVSDVTNSPYLINVSAFIDYRVAVRAIAVNPPSTEVTNWPVLPTEEWSS